MEITDRLFKESPLFMGISEVQSFSFDAAVWGIDTPISAGTAYIYNDNDVDLSSTLLESGGTAGGTISGSTITLPHVTGLVSGVRYRLFAKFSSSDGEIREPWTWLYGQDLSSGACRAGMKYVVSRLRQMTNADVHELAIAGQVYWSDSDIQDVLDRYSTRVIEKELEFVPQYEDGTVIYKILPTNIKDLEGPSSGATRWVMRDTVGAAIGTALYSYNDYTGMVDFSSDTGGTISTNLTAYTYDVYAAAADIWDWRIANFAMWYDFRSENQSMSRSQAFKQAKLMRDAMLERKGTNIYGSGDIRTSTITRSDVTQSYNLY